MLIFHALMMKYCNSWHVVDYSLNIMIFSIIVIQLYMFNMDVYRAFVSTNYGSYKPLKLYIALTSLT